ncbi:hypothetical protein NDU88_000349 [Pleurodeles waltl]|uniref:Uncharacterized protein n=1 Tax=Pleurodeles waltl TaxID=8319 RepID=A0AAV7LIB1_PLEWA|nr:hypothetical protein NDU88_000349 [Pleurodeles waltl]
MQRRRHGPGSLFSQLVQLTRTRGTRHPAATAATPAHPHAQPARARSASAGRNKHRADIRAANSAREAPAWASPARLVVRRPSPCPLSLVSRSGNDCHAFLREGLSLRGRAPQFRFAARLSAATFITHKRQEVAEVPFSEEIILYN